MTLEELRERIKNELVLHEGNVADWQWTRTGLPAEATELGISDFLRLVDDVSRSLNAQFSKILDLQAVIRKVAADNQKKLSEVQIGGFALDAERLGLSRSFVTEQWVPRILTQLPDAPTAESAKPVIPLATSGTSAVATAVDLAGSSGTLPSTPPVGSGSSHGALVETAETMQGKVRDILDDYKEHIPAPAIRALFKAVNYDEKALADAVLAYLTANFYASENEPKGATLREKLISTDWRHLAWWDRTAQVPNVSAPAAPVQASATPVSGTSVPAVPKSSSGWRDFVVALLIAGGLIGFVVVLLKSNESSASKEKERIQTEQAEARRLSEERAQKEPAKPKRKRKAATRSTQITDRKKAADAAVAKPTSPREEPYDELFNDVGQYGDRRARKDGQWGLWRKGKWMVLPVYDEIDVYKDGRARVTVNGNSYDIDRNGDRIR